jgi:RNA polymerase sigma-70 factor (ECF subfamily)
MHSKHAQFESLHREYLGMVYHMCLGFVKGDKDLAADLAQETFINTWRALDNFKGASTFKTWIYQITVNTCLKYLRDRKVKQHVALEPELMHHLVDTSAPAHDPHYRSLYQAIGRLGEVDRLIIMMVLDELEYEEIARVMGINEGNLRVKIHRIKKNLKTILEND